MTDSLFFDSDCISAFLWVNEQNLLNLLYPGKVVIPKPVYDELSFPTTPHLKQRIDYLINNGQVGLVTINVDSETYTLYQKLTTSSHEGHKVIGSGEAASIALAKTCNGIVASNNLKDISSFISEFGLRHITTGDILVEALRGRGKIHGSRFSHGYSSLLPAMCSGSSLCTVQIKQVCTRGS